MAGLNLGLDYLFLVAYPFSIGLACVMVSRRLHTRAGGFSKLGVGLAWGQGAATGKFILVALGLLYVLVGLALGRTESL